MSSFSRILMMAACLMAPATAQSIVINELVAKNNSGVTDEAGQYEDWVELLNISTVPVLLDGLYLTDKMTNLTKWAIPAGYTIQPGDTLLIWLDEDGSDGPLHANFKLSANGELVAIVDTDGTTILDTYSFGAQVADISCGRLYDGGLPWVTFVQPTPYTVNQQAGCGLRQFSAEDSTLHTITLDAPAGISVGQSATIESRMGPAFGTVILAVAVFGGNSPLPGATVSLLLGAGTAPMTTAAADAIGAADFTFVLPNIPALSGVTAYVQTFAADASAVLFASNGLEIIICP